MLKDRLIGYKNKLILVLVLRVASAMGLIWHQATFHNQYVLLPEENMFSSPLSLQYQVHLRRM